jgi:hypothetical protein
MRADQQQIVEKGRLAIADGGIHHHHVQTPPHDGRVLDADLAHGFDAAHLEEGEIVGVMRDAHRIGVREADSDLGRR